MTDAPAAVAATPLDIGPPFPLRVSIPTGWLTYPRISTDLETPAQLFAAATRPVTPHGSINGDWDYDAFGLAADGILVLVLAESVARFPTYDPGRPAAGGFSYDDLPLWNDSTDGFERRWAWYSSGANVYYVGTWVGNAAADVPALKEIIDSLHVPA